MSAKFTKFDIGSIKSKRGTKKNSAAILPKAILRHKKKITAQAFAFAASCAILVLFLRFGLYLSKASNAKGEILGAATQASLDLTSAGQNLKHQNLAQALQLFQSAQANAKAAQEKLDSFKALTWVTPQADSANHIISGASYLAQAGEKLTQALDLFSDVKLSTAGIENENFTDKLSANKDLLAQSRDLVEKSATEFRQAGSVPADYGQSLETAKTQVVQLDLVLGKLIDLENLYLNIFSGNKTYLLIFQNYDEARATGGFIGTYGVLRMANEKIGKLSINSIYDLDGRIYSQIAAPGPFQPDIPRWGIRDANWFADFPLSARKLLHFFEQGSQTADGVISFTPKVYEDLLSISGPIDMPDYGVTITAENFQEVVQYKTSVDYDKAQNKPKQMLADFAPKLLARLATLPKDQLLDLLQVMQDNLNQRQIMLYSSDPKMESTIDNLNASGKVLPSDYDYLSIVNSNLGGTKTDLKVQQSASLNSKILSDGSVINKLFIDRKNSAMENNKDYLRVLVPLGSQFVSAAGFDDTPLFDSVSRNLTTDPDLMAWDQGSEHSNIFVRVESGKTEFAGWVNTKPNEDRTLTLTYILPFKVNSAYSLLLQKQAGSRPFDFGNSLEFTGQLAWKSDAVSLGSHILRYSSNSNTDDFWAAVFK